MIQRIWRRAVIGGLAGLVVATAQAQEAEPVADGPLLRTEFETSETVPGQPLSLRLTVLVPTHMPKPPVWPTLDQPDLMIRVPSRGTGPTSDRVNGESWSGVTRRYLITPLQPGSYTIPPGQLTVTWADPDGGADRTATATTEAIRFAAPVPEGAESLDPFVSATDVSLRAEVHGTPSDMAPGDSVTLTVTATLTGGSALMLPSLVPDLQIDGIALYRDDPQVSETEDRGTLGGQRVETLTLVAEGGGAGTIPALELAWYNTDSGAVETTTTDPVDIAISGPPLRAERPPLSARQIGLIAAALGLLAVLVVLARPVLARLRAARDRHRASEPYAYRALRGTIRARDWPGLHPALHRWAMRCDGADPQTHPAVVAALVALGAARYKDGEPNRAATAWQGLDAAVASARRDRHAMANRPDLLPLNPIR